MNSSPRQADGLAAEALRGRAAGSPVGRAVGAFWGRVAANPRVRVWAPPVAVTLLGGILRFWRLGFPHKLSFDETYYVKDSFSLLRYGVELNWTKDKDDLFVAGDYSALESTGAYVVHPPVGKWLIAFGMWLFGPESSFGWRFSAAVFGTAAVFLTILVGWRLLRSQPLGLLAGLAVAVDGIGIVLSRTGLLDVFLMFFVLLAFWLILKDRAVMDARLERQLRTPVGHGPLGAPLYPGRTFGPGLGMRWYLLGAGAALGLACGVKWSGLFFLAAFGVMTVAWDAAARRRAGIRGWLPAGLLRDAPKAFALMVPVALVVYTASWAGWLASDRGYHRQLGADDALYSVDWIPAGVRALAAYHQQAYGFHTTLTTEHLYQSNPALWLLQARPTSFYYESDPTCGSDSCSQAITALGNPLLWWIGAAALIVVVYNAVVWADRRAWAIVAGYAGGYLPWLFYAQRTIFTFYTVAFLPFVALALAYAAGRLIGPAAPSVWPDLDWETRRRRRIRLVLLSAGAVVVISAFFFPIWSGQSVPYRFWDMHMWYPSWV